VALIYLYTDAGHPSPCDTDVLHVSAGPHTESQGDPGDPDILLVYQTPKETLVTLIFYLYTRLLIGTNLCTVLMC
jgi:hypothetical protein